MLLRIRDGKQGPGEAEARPRDAVDLLLDCHARIRSFHGLAVKLADTASPTPDEITGAAAANGIHIKKNTIQGFTAAWLVANPANVIDSLVL